VRSLSSGESQAGASHLDYSTSKLLFLFIPKVYPLPPFDWLSKNKIGIALLLFTSWPSNHDVIRGVLGCP